MDKEKVNKRRGALLLLLLLLILVLSGFIFFNFFMGDKNDIYKDRDAQLGLLPNMTEEEVRQRLDTVVSEGMMNVSINPHPVFENGSAKGDLRIENIQQNHYSYIVSIIRDDTGEEIYKSGLLMPGYYIENAALDKPLPKGEYDATAKFLAYQNEGEDPIGSAVVKIKLTVQN